MMFVKQLSTIMLAGAILLTGCAGRTPAPQAELPQPPQRLAQADAQVNRPEGLPRPPSPRLGNRTGDRQPLAGNAERRAGQELPANLAQPATTVDYDAAQMITTFAQSYLGITPTVVRAQGTSGDLILPPQISQKINGSVDLAGQVSAGVITVGDQRGAAQVAVGGGSISGDLQADISNGALGAYSLLLPGVATPSDAGAALALLTSTYPGLAAYDLQPETGGQGYVFRAVTTTPGLDLQTQQATVVAQVVVAGVSGQGRAAVVWVVVGNGTFAVAL
jgi:hypothetical protein